jgi:hypothetical protein
MLREKSLDKMAKRRSGARVQVRHGLMVGIDRRGMSLFSLNIVQFIASNHPSFDTVERELAPSSRIIDAFPRPPQFCAPDRQAAANKCRSLDSTQLL